MKKKSIILSLSTILSIQLLANEINMDGKSVKLQSQSSLYCIEPEDMIGEEGTKLIQVPCQEKDNQLITFSKVEDDYYKLILNNNLEVSVASSSKSNGVNIVQTNKGDLFKIIPKDMGFSLKTKNNRYISITSYNTDIVQYATDRLPLQEWNLLMSDSDNMSNKELTSCKKILDTGLSNGDGVYTIYPNGNDLSKKVYCNMTIDGGGWTAFFSGKNGSENVFGQFESGDIFNTSEEYLYRLPSSITESNVFAASCGNAMIKFNVNDNIIDFFSNGNQHSLQDISNVTSIGEQSIGYLPEMIWTGAGDNKGWILSTHNTTNLNEAFSSSYNYNSAWNYCNSKSDSSSNIKLYYK